MARANMTNVWLSASVVAGLVGGAFGQCTPAWDTAAGNPGVAGGYAAPARLWNGNLYVGGSFSSAGGNPANAFLAAWNPTTGVWSPQGTGIGEGFTNAFMTALLPYNPGSGEQLVAAGFYDNAGGVAQSASLAMWDGTSWHAMGTGWTGTTRQAVWSMAVWNGQLYIGGGIVNQPALIAGQPWAGLARWDGTTWHPINTSIVGFSPVVNALMVYDDGTGERLYAAGRFTSIDGVSNTGLIARWTGETWQPVGNGLVSTQTLFGLEGLTAFNDGTGTALYVAGYAFNGATGGTANVAKWNGSSWSAVGGQIGTGRLTSITTFDDGSGNKLYIGGTAMPQINYVARWENSAWTPVGGGITGPGLSSQFPSVFGLRAEADRLYVMGDYTQVNSAGANGVAAWHGCAATCYANCDGSTAAPILNVADFTCFLQKFASADPYANCDGSTAAPILNVADFTCFLQKFAAGCP